MKGIYSDCIESLKESDLYDCFIWLAEASCINIPELHWIEVNPMSMNDAVEILKQHTPTISKEVLKRNIQRLIHKGLLKYSDHKIDYIDNFKDTQAPLRDNKYFKSLLEFEKNVTDESNIELSQNAQISGIDSRVVFRCQSDSCKGSYEFDGNAGRSLPVASCGDV